MGGERMPEAESPPVRMEGAPQRGSGWARSDPLEGVRFCVIDTETTGLNPRLDRLISIGGVVVLGGQIVVQDSFEAMVPVAYNSPTVVVHGITREESRKGVPEDQALSGFAEWLDGSILVGHHLSHDLEVLAWRIREHGREPPRNPAIDTLHLVHALADAALLPMAEAPGAGSLDGLCLRFGIPPHDRHTAAGDAFLTAQILLRLLRLAGRAGWRDLGALLDRASVPGRTQDDPR